MADGSRLPREAWIPLLVGIYWLWYAPEHGLIGFLFSIVPGCLLVGSGVSMLLMPGDRRIAQFTAAGGLAGIVFAFPALFVMSFSHGLMLILASSAAFVAAGYHAVALEPAVDDVPDPQPGLRLSALVAADEAVLAALLALIDFPGRADHVKVEREVSDARDLFEKNGWLEDPASYHRTPPPLEKPVLRRERTRGIEFEHLSFESGYEPHVDEPGRDRWLSYSANQTGHAWVMRHAGEDRPWLMCIHGYCMGNPWIDLAVFDPAYYHHELGLNLIVPTLPLHGPRSIGRRSGEGFFQANVLDTIHAEAQAMWDLRRCIGWARTQSDSPLGVFGLSLGGYNAALLSAFDADLACVIAGVPAADFASIVFRHGPFLTLRAANEIGLVEDRMRELKRVVSPLDLEPRVPRQRRYIFAGVADRVVPAAQVRDLWRHWEEPEIVWYQGSHVSLRAHPEVRSLVPRALRESGLIGGQGRVAHA